ncbi:hypothetical protein KC19_5G019500 [Ceratodon purpureus]|uniref:Uncharacterized protein n=1 Tax=Ceratodon purpureus TaxID=3225 RepID=A0A8T0HY66_CERPU|nr:hypothetical protein KC19_5G019500 [Ceratodon purpureus]
MGGRLRLEAEECCHWHYSRQCMVARRGDLAMLKGGLFRDWWTHFRGSKHR